jgi:hypothetical protein
MEKTFQQKNFNNFVWTPLGSRVNIYINFCLQVHFMVSAAWYCCHYLPPVSTTLSNMVEKFATGVADTGGAPWLTNISANFRKNSKRSKWNTLGLGGNWFMKLTRSKKSRDTVPLSNYTQLTREVIIFFFLFVQRCPSQDNTRLECVTVTCLGPYCFVFWFWHVVFLNGVNLSAIKLRGLGGPISNSRCYINVN